MGTRTTDSFTASKGLLQDYRTCPTLFNVYLESILKFWKRKFVCVGIGVPIRNEHLYITYSSTRLRMTKTVFAQYTYELGFMDRKLKEALPEQIFNKTKYLITADGTDIEQKLMISETGKFKYLDYITTKNTTTKEKTERL